MPLRVIIWLILIAIVAGAATIFAAQFVGISFALLGLLAAGAALALRLWMMRP
ncbi:hypothetical protein [Pseudorhodobacter sp.]|uniref:hypothetical protein n=1 Tax=Pseudorhodobacter sp. TaxID=1934400 RepID=UPI002648E88C|nr:hypothetical protein [Pseudorhodobacter sp.]MDN5788073.1 hypothetical protein [Pseudorhodobacter sp.]